MSNARLEMLTQFLKDKPNDPFVRYGLAMEYKNLGRLDDAAKAFDELMKAHPDYVATYLHAGNTLVSLGKADEAKGIYQTGIVQAKVKGDMHAASELEGALAALG